MCRYISLRALIHNCYNKLTNKQYYDVKTCMIYLAEINDYFNSFFRCPSEIVARYLLNKNNMT